MNKFLGAFVCVLYGSAPIFAAIAFAVS